MSKLTIYQEIRRHKDLGYTSIKWKCTKCNMNIELPQQQNFSYCPHCGAKIIKKIGGKVQP